MVKSPTPKTGIISVALGIALIGGTRPRLVATMEISAAPTCATPSGCRVIGRPVKRSEWWLATTPVRRVAPVVATGSITGILPWAGPILFIIVINTQIAYSFWDTFTCIGRLFREWKQLFRQIYLCRTANMSWRTCVVVKQIQSNQPSDTALIISAFIFGWSRTTKVLSKRTLLFGWRARNRRARFT